MRNVLIAIAAAAVAVAATPAVADGVGKAWRGHAYRVGAISRNVITPYYVGYYPGHYSYYLPDPIYVAVLYRRDVPRCWRWRCGNGYWFR